MRELLVVTMLCFVAGCAIDASGEADVEAVGEAESGVKYENGLTPNGLTPNGLTPNGLTPNGLDPSSLSPEVERALEDPGSDGITSRQFLKYVVGCAFDRSQSFVMSWRDADGAQHDETYWGKLGLAPEWQSEPLSPTKQRWVSACLAARTNYWGISVTLSVRGELDALRTTREERLLFTRREGAFWGNLFSATPEIHACYDAENVGHSRSRYRVCAAGRSDDDTGFSCGVLERSGDCSTLCAEVPHDRDKRLLRCSGAAEVITSYLR